MKKRVFLLLAAVLIALSLVSCQKNPSAELPEFHFASEITEEVRADAEKTLSVFMQAFEEDNAKAALDLFSDGFECTEDELSAFFTELSNLAESPFVPYDAYYMNDLEVSEALIRVKKDENSKDYIELTPASRELYCAMYASEGDVTSYMMTILLTREDGGFKVAWINPSDFKFNKNDAPAFYKKTLALYEEEKLIPAYVSSCMLSSVLRPGGYFRYEKDVEMEDLCYKLYAEVSDAFALPLELKDTSSSVLHEVGITRNAEHGVIPLIRAKTDVSTEDEAALEKECSRIIKALEKLSPGMAEVAKYVCFDVTNDEISENQTTVNSKKIVISVG